MAKINIDRLFLALLTKDEIGAGNLIYQIPEYIPGIKEFNAKVKANTEKLYAEGVVWDQDTTLEDVEIDFDVADFNNAQCAKYLGHAVAAEGGVVSNKDDTAPYIAMLYEYTRRGGTKGYRVYYKGKLVEPDEGVKGKEGKTEYQTNKITATFQALRNNGNWKYAVDADDPNAPEGLATSFFANVITPGSDIVAATVACVPVDAATGISGTADIVFTFNKAIQSSTVDESSVFLIKADGAAIPATLTVGTNNTVVTLNPTASLTAGAYVAIVTKAVKSASGIPMATNTVVNFTV